MWEQELDELETAPSAAGSAEWDAYVATVQDALEEWWDSSATASALQQERESP
jgi:hypothetical protein